MELSREREAELLEQNKHNIKKSVNRFMSRRSRNPVIKIEFSDFEQEVSIVFLNYIRKCKTDEDLNKFPWRDAENAMARLVLASQHITVPSKSTSVFNKLIKKIPETVPYELLTDDGIGVDGLSVKWVSDAEAEVDLEAFLSTRSDSMRRIIHYYLHGMRVNDIAECIGCTRQNVYKIIDKFSVEFEKFRQGD